MTFVLNILHKDFSLMATDRRGNAEGPITMTVGNITINTTGGGTIDGFKKTHLNSTQKVAIAIAGQTQAHPYLEEAKEKASPKEIIDLILDTEKKSFAPNDLEDLLNLKPQMENSTLVSFYDQVTDSFITSMHIYTRYLNYNNITMRQANPSAQLLHLGTGSSKFEEAVGLDEINSFIDKMKEDTSVDLILKWLDMAFEKVSKIAEGCSAEYDACIITRETQTFTSLRSTNETRFSPVVAS